MSLIGAIPQGTGDRMAQTIRGCLESEIVKIVNEEANEAGKRVEARVKAKAAEFAVSVSSKVNFETLGKELAILIRFPKELMASRTV